MSFLNREDAGKQLTKYLTKYIKKRDCLTVGLSRGGIIVANAISKELEVPLDFICVKKVSHLINPEYAVGAVTEYHDILINQETAFSMGFDQVALNQRIEEKYREAKTLSNAYRQFLSKLDWEGKEILLIDDGLATGLTMKVAVLSIKSQKVKKITIAVPVSSLHAAEELKGQSDEFISIIITDAFSSVGQFYQEFEDPNHEKILQILKRANR